MCATRNLRLTMRRTKLAGKSTQREANGLINYSPDTRGVVLEIITDDYEKLFKRKHGTQNWKRACIASKTIQIILLKTTKINDDSVLRVRGNS